MRFILVQVPADLTEPHGSPRVTVNYSDCNTLSNGAWPPPQLLAEECTGVYYSVNA